MADKLLPALAAGIPIALVIFLLAKKRPAEGETTTLTPLLSFVAPIAAAAILFLAVMPLGQHAHVSSPIVVAALAPLLVYVAYRPILSAFLNPLLFLATSAVMYIITGQDQLAENYNTQYDPLGIMLYMAFSTVGSFIFGFVGILGTNRNYRKQIH